MRTLLTAILCTTLLSHPVFAQNQPQSVALLPLGGGGVTSQTCQPQTVDGGPYTLPSDCIINAQGHLWSAPNGGTTINYDGTGYWTGPGVLAMGRLNATFLWEQPDTFCGTQWRQYAGASNSEVTAGFGPALTNFQDTTKGTSWGSFQVLLANASANDNLTVSAAPSLYSSGGTLSPCWRESVGQLQWPNGVVMNLVDPSHALVNIAGQFDILANNVQVIGDAVTPAQLDQIRFRDNSLNPTIKHIHIKPLTFNTFTSTDQCGGGSPGNGITTSGFQSTVTLSDILVELCGTGAPGTDHDFYSSAAKDNGDPTANVQGDHLTAKNVLGGGWGLKIRPGNTGNNLSYIRVYCDLALRTSAGCNTNGAMDFPCGGIQNVTHFVLEVLGFNQTDAGNPSSNWYMVKYGEELFGSGNVNFCTTAATAAEYPTNTLTMDTGWFIWDGNCPGAAINNRAILVCGDGGTCVETGTGWNPVLTVKNSKIVSDDGTNVPGENASQACNFNNSLGPNVVDGGGNTFYASRAAAGLAPWPFEPATP